jgi:hypothetical protein
MEKLMIFGFLVWLVLSCCSNLYGSIRSVFLHVFLVNKNRISSMVTVFFFCLFGSVHFFCMQFSFHSRNQRFWFGNPKVWFCG